MDINVTIKKNLQIRAFYLFFIIYEIQIGVGVLGASRYIFSNAYQDSWISILIMFVFMLLVAYVMLIILKQYDSADIFGIQVDIFGNWIGKLFGTIYILFFAATLISVILTYIEVVKIFLYPTIPSYVIAILLLSLVVYSVLGGLRTVVGVTFVFFVTTQWLLVFYYDPMTRMDWTHLLPMFHTAVSDLLLGTKAMTYTVTGFEILFVIYPFISNKEKAKWPVFSGIALTSFMVLVSTIVAIGYFSPRDLPDIEWTHVALFKNISYTFVERIDYVYIAEWMMVIIPNIALYMWAITVGIKRMYKISQRTTLYITAAITLIITSIIQADIYINWLTDTISNVGFWLIFIYPFVLLPLVLVKKKWQKRKGGG